MRPIGAAYRLFHAKNRLHLVVFSFLYLPMVIPTDQPVERVLPRLRAVKLARRLLGKNKQEHHLVGFSRFLAYASPVYHAAWLGGTWMRQGWLLFPFKKAARFMRTAPLYMFTATRALSIFSLGARRHSSILRRQLSPQPLYSISISGGTSSSSGTYFPFFLRCRTHSVSRYSICPLTDRKSSSAQAAIAAYSLGDRRRGTCFFWFSFILLNTGCLNSQPAARHGYRKAPREGWRPSPLSAPHPALPPDSRSAAPGPSPPYRPRRPRSFCVRR